MEAPNGKFTKFFWYKILIQMEATWSAWDGLEFNDYFYLQHKLFKFIRIKRIYGYKADQHPNYYDFLQKIKKYDSTK